MAERFTFPQTGDKDDAEHFGAMIGQANMSNYVETGLSLQNYNSAGPDIDVTTGKCFISQTSETASSSGDTILSTNSVVQIPAVTALALTDSAVNEIYVNPDFGTDDNGTVNATTTGVPAGSLKIGEVDTSADTVDQNFNREPDITVLSITDADGNTVYSAANNWIPQARLEGPPGSLSAYPLANGDIANSSVTVTAGNQLTGGGSVALGGSVTIDVDEGSGSGLDADTVDGQEPPFGATAEQYRLILSNTGEY